FWRERLGSDPSVLGADLDLGGQPYRVVGILDAGFRLPERRADLFVPLRAGYPDMARYRGVHALQSVWKLAPGATLSQVRQQFDAAAKGLAKLYPEENTGRQFVPLPLLERVSGESRPALLLLSGAVGLVLLIACANLASLLLGRSFARS